jgi:hypothetical protein
MIGVDSPRVLFAGIVLAFAVVLGRPAVARADAEKASCQVFEIKASNDDGGVDAALKPLAKKLKKPPFSAWKRFALLKKHDKAAVKMKAVELRLVPGGTLSILYRERANAKGKARLRLTFTLDDKGGKRLFNGTVAVDVGDYSLIGGETLEDGATYILAVSCKV